ncbi:MAG: right-handed parallel beta-helix repeat-containing protein, partial [Bradymonadales bacterium]|nr:right-handed parallel beta-helix repeat-containing protein [Bradymonadales bacterium]
ASGPYRYTDPGLYIATLTVTDGDGDLGSASVTIEVAPGNRPPIADAGDPGCILTGNLIVLDGAASCDPDDSADECQDDLAWQNLDFRWSFVDKPPDSQATLNDATVVRPSFHPDLDGEYRLRLEVFDGVFTDTATVVIEASSEIVLAVVGEEERYGNPGDPIPDAEPLQVQAQVICPTIELVELPGVSILWQAENAAFDETGGDLAISKTGDGGIATIDAYFGQSAQWGAVRATVDPADLGDTPPGAMAGAMASFGFNILCSAAEECEGGFCDLAVARPICIGPWHVDPQATGLGNGKTWSDGFSDLQDALDAASASQEIWVAGGTYRPSARTDPDDPRTATFLLDREIGLVGGFNGGELHLGERPSSLAETVLSGDLGEEVSSFHVVTVSGDGVTIEGFTIRDGTAIDLEGEAIETGGGLLAAGVSDLAVRNTVFTGNAADYGGGMYGLELSDTTIEDCLFEENGALIDGGGMMLEDCPDTVRVLHADFLFNQGGGRGGGLYLENSSAVVDGSRFGKNHADNYNGGAVAIDGEGSAPWLTNCLFIRNEAWWYGGGIAIYGTSNSPLVTNSIFFKNRSIEHVGSFDHVRVADNNTPLFVNDVFSSGFVYVPAGSVHYSAVASWDAAELEPCLDDDLLYGCWNLRTECSEGFCIDPTNINTLPAFICSADPGNLDPCDYDEDFHYLTSSSAGINDGVRVFNEVDYCPPTDMDGTPRPQPAGGSCDLGAYEWVEDD